MDNFSDYQTQMGLKDIPNQRIIELENGNKLYLKRVDPHGFIYLNLERGQLPEHYKGAYTDWGMARQAAAKYQSERKQAVNQELKDKPFKDK